MGSTQEIKRERERNKKAGNSERDKGWYSFVLGLSLCNFNPFLGQGIERVLKRFGSNIIFFNGLRDPWSGGGVLKNISRSVVAIVAKEGAHHVDLRFSTKEDPEWLKEVRIQEVNIIAGWISQHYHDLIHLSS